MRFRLEQTATAGCHTVKRLLDDVLCTDGFAGFQKALCKDQKLVVVVKAPHRLPGGFDRVLHPLQTLGDLTGFKDAPAQEERADDKHIGGLLATNSYCQLSVLATRLRGAKKLLKRGRPPCRVRQARG